MKTTRTTSKENSSPSPSPTRRNAISRLVTLPILLRGQRSDHFIVPNVSDRPAAIAGGDPESFVNPGEVEGKISAFALLRLRTTTSATSICTPPPPFATLEVHAHSVQSPEGCPRHARPPPARHRPLEPRRIHRPLGLLPLRLRRDPHPHLRGHLPLRPRRRRRDRHRLQGDVYLEDRARAQSEKAQSLTLRPRTPPESSAPTSSTTSADTGQLQKFFYIGPQFRREAPSTRTATASSGRSESRSSAPSPPAPNLHCATPKSSRCSPRSR